MQRIRVLLADEHVLVVEGLARLIQPEFELVGKSYDGRSAVQAARRARPDVVLLGISLPQLNGLAAARQILSELPHTRVVFVTMHADVAYLAEALRCGATGYLLKDAACPELSEAIRTVVRGETYISREMANRFARGNGTRKIALRKLTPRQEQVLQLIAEGHTQTRIGAQLNISVKTAEFHRSAILQKLGLRTTADLIRYAIRARDHDGTTVQATSDLSSRSCIGEARLTICTGDHPRA